MSLQLQILKSPSPVFGHRRKPLSNSQVEASMTTFPTSSLNIIMCRSTRKNILTKTTFFPLLPTKTSNPLIFFIFPTLKRTFQTLEHTFHALKYTFQILEHIFPLLTVILSPKGKIIYPYSSSSPLPLSPPSLPSIVNSQLSTVNSPYTPILFTLHAKIVQKCLNVS